jgi:undecaprenyl-diphosphatase
MESILAGDLHGEHIRLRITMPICTMPKTGILLIAGLFIIWNSLTAVHAVEPGHPGARELDEAGQHQYDLSWFQAFLLGTVEGITEFLPVSSTGHLIITQQFLGIGNSPRHKDAADAYAIIIQGGAILSVLGIYWRRGLQISRGLTGHDRKGLSLAINLVVAFLPAAFLGLLLEGVIKQYLFGIVPIVIAWFVGGLAIFALDRRSRAQQEQHGLLTDITLMSSKCALLIGLFQCVAMWPGVSRSLATILGGMMLGLSLPAAVEFSFLLGVVTLLSATVYEALTKGDMILHSFGILSPLIGFLSAFVAAWIAVKWMLAYLQKHSLVIFAYYRILLALMVSLFLLFDFF